MEQKGKSKIVPLKKYGARNRVEIAKSGMKITKEKKRKNLKMPRLSSGRRNERAIRSLET